MAFNLSEYQTVQDRVEIFRKLYPEGRIISEIVLINEEQVVVKCSIWTDPKDPNPVAVDFAQETIGSSNINRTSFLENCTTSAVGRAISLLGGEMSPKGKKPSREEMAKAKRAEATPRDFVADAGKINDLEELRKLYAAAVAAKADKTTLDFILQRSEDLKN